MRSRLPAGERGFALLIVLWTLVLISLIVMAVISSTRSTARLDAADARLAIGEAQAEAAIQSGIFHLLAEDGRHWAPNGQWHLLHDPDLHGRLRLRPEADALNPNTAPPALMAAVFASLGQPEDAAAALAHVLVVWRTPPRLIQQANRKGFTLPATNACHPPGRAFRTIDDLGAVPGLTPALLAALRPHLSFTQMTPPSPHTHDPLLRKAFLHLQAQRADHSGRSSLLDADALATPRNEALTVLIDVQVPIGHGQRITRRAYVIIDPMRSPGWSVARLDAITEPAPDERSSVP